MCFSAIAVANTILDMAVERKINDITPMKLQKLVFLAHAVYYKLNRDESGEGKPLISDPIGVWQYGPVIQDLYREFRDFGSSAITEYANNASGSISIVPKSRSDIYEHLDNILNLFGDISAWRLSELTHLENTAWSRAKDAGRRYIDTSDLENGLIYRA